jgi:tRNA(Arg) A34 adenosine deaminase TadA
VEIQKIEVLKILLDWGERERSLGAHTRGDQQQDPFQHAEIAEFTTIANNLAEWLDREDEIARNIAKAKR